MNRYSISVEIDKIAAPLFTSIHSVKIPNIDVKIPKIKPVFGLISPEGIGLFLVLSINLSRSDSKNSFRAAAPHDDKREPKIKEIINKNSKSYMVCSIFVMPA